MQAVLFALLLVACGACGSSERGTAKEPADVDASADGPRQATVTIIVVEEGVDAGAP